MYTEYVPPAPPPVNNPYNESKEDFAGVVHDMANLDPATIITLDNQIEDKAARPQ